jgi:transcriptional regulator with XRE-family HTH domain
LVALGKNCSARRNDCGRYRRHRGESHEHVIHEERQKTGLNQNELDGRAGLHPSAISFFERGLRSPTLYTVFAVADALKIAPSDIVLAVKEKKPILS